MTSSPKLLASDVSPDTDWIFFTKPAKDWNEALPIGNGRMGAMIFGGVKSERYQLNDSTFWAGHPHDYSVPGSFDHLADIRKLLFAGKESEASGLADKSFMGNPKFQAAYQSAGDLFLDFDHTEIADEYNRWLDVKHGLAGVAQLVEGQPFDRESFASYPHKVVAIHLLGHRKGTLSFAARLVSDHSFRMDRVDANTVILRGQWRDDGKKAAWTASWDKPGIRLAIGLRIITNGGECVATKEGFQVKNADSAVLLLTTGTSFVNYKDISGDEMAEIVPTLDRATELGYEKLRKAHQDDLNQLLGRTTLSLGEPTDKARITPDRLEAVRRGESDPALAALYFNFGRYLLAACSRPGGQAANLQGLWNKDRRPAWGSKYTTNINLQMNYWPAEVANLGECTEPLFSLIDDLRVTGAKTARDHYNSKGWVLHHNTDVWRGAAPVDGVWGVWPMGSAWLALHPWEHYRFSGDKEFLKNRAWPQMKEAADFVLDFLIKAPEGTRFPGKLVTNPSHSPENSFTKPDGSRGMFTYAATMDLQICRELFESCLSAMRELGLKDADYKLRIEAALRDLAPVQISPKTGRLQEWIEDYDEPEPGHRHMSHLFGLYPGSQMTSTGSPAMFAAARKSLDHRLANGGGGTGWSRAWLVSLFARLLDGEAAAFHLSQLFAKSTQNNLFDSHPPFQIDGNFGGTAGIAEMLVQSHEFDEKGDPLVRFLPAIPSAWKQGSFSGLRARGGFEVSGEWKPGFRSFVIKALTGGRVSVEIGGKIQSRELKKGEKWRL